MLRYMPGKAGVVALAFVVALWVGVLGSGAIAGLSQWSEHISAVEYEKRYGNVYLGGHPQPVEWTTFSLSPQSDPLYYAYGFGCPFGTMVELGPLDRRDLWRSHGWKP